MSRASKLFLALLVIGGLAVWQYPQAFQLATVKALWAKIDRAINGEAKSSAAATAKTPTARAGAAGNASAPVARARKCQTGGGQIIYVSQPCPPGAKELPMTDGTVTEIDLSAGNAAMAASAAKPGAAANANSASAAPKPVAETVRSKVVDQAVKADR